MDDAPDRLEQLWNDLLSRQPSLVRSAFETLDADSRTAVVAHLQRMAHESGWYPDQQASAAAALKALGHAPQRGD